MARRTALTEVRESDGTLEGFAYDGKALAYVDGEGSVLCAPCARKSETVEGQPARWLPQGWFAVEPEAEPCAADLCDECGDELDPRIADARRFADRPACTGNHTGLVVGGCPGCEYDVAQAMPPGAALMADILSEV
jgi:hypothetical protein